MPKDIAKIILVYKKKVIHLDQATSNRKDTKRSTTIEPGKSSDMNCVVI